MARQQKTNKYEKRKFLRINISMISLSLDELKLIAKLVELKAKNRGIKDYENKSEDDLIKILSELKTKISVSKKKIKSIKKILIN